MFQTLMRLVLALILTIVSIGINPTPAHASVSPIEPQYACALKSNGVLRLVSNSRECKKNMTFVNVKPNPSSTAGTSGKKTLVQSGDNYVSCTLP